MSSERHRIIRVVVGTAIAIHLGVVGASAFYFAWGLADSGPGLDPLRPIPIVAIYGGPALLALAGLRGRHPLLLAAALASGLLALVPFSLHSLVLGPVGIAYAVGFGRLTTSEHDRAAVVAVVACPLLLVAAFLALVLHEDPACYEEHADGEVVIDRDPDGFSSGAGGSSGEDHGRLDADDGVVRAGCTSDRIVWWEAALSLALAGGGLAVGPLTVANVSRGRGVRTPPAS